MSKKPRRKCPQCGRETDRASYRYCSNACQIKRQYERYIESWKEGKVKGLQRSGGVSAHIKKYLRKRYGSQCSVCGWSVVNVETGEVPLSVGHSDGDFRNMTEHNLRLLCRNCIQIKSVRVTPHKKKNSAQSWIRLISK